MNYLKLLLDPRGKINRTSYAIAYAICLVMLIIPAFLSINAYRSYMHQAMEGFVIYRDPLLNNGTALISAILCIASILGLIFTKIKRFRDLNMSPFYILFFMVPLLNIYFLFLLFLRKSVVILSMIYTSVASLEEAQTLAEQAIAGKYAGCVNMIPGIHSIYEWEGAIQRTQECMLLFKTTPERVKPLIQWLLTEHPYTTPAILSTELQSTNEFYNYIQSHIA